MKNLNHLNLKELTTNELNEFAGGSWLSDVVDVIETAIVWYENIKRFTPII